MLLLIIDLIERILAWMKPFARQPKSQLDFGEASKLSANLPSDDDVRSCFAELKLKYPLTKAKGTKICGVENKLTGEVILHVDAKDSRQDSLLWSEMSNRFGDFYNISNV